MVESGIDPVAVKAVIPVGRREAIAAISVVVPVKTAEAGADEEATAAEPAQAVETKSAASKMEASEMAATKVEATEVTATTKMPAAEVPPAKTAGAGGLGLGDDSRDERCEHDTLL